MTESWFKKWFNSKDYLDLYKHRDSSDAKKIVTLINQNIKLKKGADVLDLACGNGRHSVLFAAKGYKVLGVDLSDFLISQANKKLKTDYSNYSKNLRFEIKDMRNLSYKNRFDLVVNLFSSFGYFDKDSQNYKVIKDVSKSLKQGGYFFFDFLNADYLKENLVPFDIKKGNRNILVQVRNIDNGFIRKDIAIFRSNSRGNYPLFSHFYEKIKLYSYKDFAAIFSKYNLKILKTFGDYNGRRFNKNKSQRLIILAQKN